MINDALEIWAHASSSIEPVFDLINVGPKSRSPFCGRFSTVNSFKATLRDFVFLSGEKDVEETDQMEVEEPSTASAMYQRTELFDR